MPEGEAPPNSALHAALDELYGAPFERFIPLRKELVARLRAAGDLEGARQIGVANKPTRSAWALNQLARTRPEVVGAIVDSRDAAVAAQKSGDAEEIRESARQHRDAIAQALKEARSILESDGASLSAAQARRMGETMQALVSDVEERQKLRAGRLTQDVAVEDPFAGLEAGGKPRRRADAETEGEAEAEPEAQSTRKRESERRRLERERAIEDARAKVTAVERSVDLARRAVTEAERALRQAQSAAEQTKSALGKLETDLALARDQLKKLSAHA